MKEAIQSPHVARFESFEVNLRSGELLKDGERIKLPEQSFQILAMLLERAGEVVLRQEIQKRLWPNDTIVEFENSINAAIKRLRVALVDSASEPRYVETLARRGYRWKVPVQWLDPNPQHQTAPATFAVVEASVYSVSRLEKDRELKHEIAPKSRLQRWILAVGAIAAMLVGGVVFWVARHAIPFSPGLPDVKLTQLTDNSPENPVTSGAISPDGKYLAYTDLQGMHIKLVGNDEAQLIPVPANLTHESFTWEVGPWFPDSKRFIVRSHRAPVNGNDWFSADTSNWIVSILGGAPMKLRDGAYVWSISPDGSMMAFGANFGMKKWDPRDETWLMSSDGTQARRIIPRGDICCVHFFPDGKRISYSSGDQLLSSDLSGGSVRTLLSAGQNHIIGAGTWLTERRFIYFDPCKHPDLMRSDTACNYWVTRLDIKGGMEKPRRLTNWVGVSATDPSATSDGKQVVFVQSSSKGLGYLADLDANGARIRTSRRFPLEEGGQDSISEWTADGQNAIVGLNRFDHYFVRMQALNSDSQSPIVSSATGLLEKSALTPDGKWLILLVFPAKGEPDVSTTVQLMRVPITGGTPEPIFSMREGSAVFCSKPPATLCAVAEESPDRRTMIVAAFDPVKGRGGELARFDLIRDREVDPYIDHLLLCDISPDGTRLAVVRGENESIEVHSLRGQPTLVIPAKRLRRLRAIAWAANGKGVFASNWTEHGREVVQVDLRGKIDVLWTCSDRCDGTPSPDGRHLGIYDQNVSANMWMMENFWAPERLRIGAVPLAV